MADEKNTESVENTGSSTTDPVEVARTGESGKEATGHIESSKPVEDVVSKSQYEELEALLGKQGTELGEYREFFNRVTPILDKLENQPDLIQAILEDKIDENLIKSVISGDVSLKAAKEVTKAHEEVKKDLTKKEYAGMTPDEIEKLVAKKVEERSSQLERKLSEKEELKDFESKTKLFIENTSDFADLADDIAQWFEDHPDQDDIRVAYDAVKGRVLDKAAKRQAEIDSAESAKDIAQNAGGGQSQQSGVIANEDVLDSLIAKNSNPNLL